MDEIAAKQVLLDFEIIALITLFAGVLFYAFVRKLSPPSEDVSSDFDHFDLVLMFFPALLFLINPLFAVLLAENG
ncbi:MAG: hypothetical protein AAF357_06610, partial [Verrucomicrobiota bacterium]